MTEMLDRARHQDLVVLAISVLEQKKTVKKYLKKKKIPFPVLLDKDGKTLRTIATSGEEDSILDHILVGNPDFSDLDDLTKQIEEGTLKFTADVENFLSKHS